MNTTHTPEPALASRPHMLESYVRLGAVLMLANQIPTWGENTLASADIDWSGRVHVVLSGRTPGEELAARLDLTQTEHETYPGDSRLTGIDAAHGLTHRVTWEGTYSGRPIMIRTYWDTPLNDAAQADTAPARIPSAQAPRPVTSTPAPRPARRIPPETSSAPAPRSTRRAPQESGQGPAPRPARRSPSETGEQSSRFAARFASTCAACEEQIETGQDVAWSDGEVVHDSCAIEAGVEVFDR
jgi:hypothetical protein